MRRVITYVLLFVLAFQATFPLAPVHARTRAANNPPVLLGTTAPYVVADLTLAGTVIGDINGSDRDGDTLTYSLLSGSGFALSSTGVLSVAAPLSRTDGKIRTITVQLSDGTVSTTARYQIIIAPTASFATKGITREYYADITGGSVDDLRNSAKYKAHTPDVTATVSQIYSNTAGDRFGYRYRGYFTVPTTGTYRFWIASDDSSELRISTAAQLGALSSAPDASVSGWTGEREWYRSSTQQTQPMKLVKGQVYGLEVLYKDAGGVDHLAVAWQGTGMPAPVNGNSSALVPDTAMLPDAALETLIPKGPLLHASIETVTNAGVNLVWTTSADAVSYRILRDGVELTTVAAAAGEYQRYSDPVTTGTHAYELVVIDANGNPSLSYEIPAIDASTLYNSYDAALANGNGDLVTDDVQVIDRAIAAIPAEQAAKQTLYESVYAGVTSMTWLPNNNGQLMAALPSATARVFPLMSANTCNSVACVRTMAVFGSSATGSRFAALPWTPAGTATVATAFNALIAWLISGNGATAPTTVGDIAILQNDSANLKTALKTFGHGTDSSITVCTVSNIATCSASKKLLIVGSSAGGDNLTNLANITTAVENATANGIPILYIEDTSYYPNKTSTYIGNTLGFAPAFIQYFSKAQIATTDIPAMITTMNTSDYADLTIVLNHLKASDWSVDLSTCPESSCSGAADTYMNAQFYAGARTFLRTKLNGFDNSTNVLFQTPSTQYTPTKYAVLLGDIYRRGIKYPLNGKTGSQKYFFRALYADHAVYNQRPYNKPQPDMGSFSRPIPADVPVYTETINVETRTGDFFTATGVYALPGRTFTIRRTDTATADFWVYANSLRANSTHEYSDYSRPKFLQSAWIPATKGKTIQITSPYGGPIQIYVRGTAAPETVSVEISNVGKHAIWNGPDTTASFKSLLEQGDYDWTEFLTPGFQVHSRRALMLETLKAPHWDTPEKLAQVTMDSFYLANYNLAGFTGTGLSLSPDVAANCTALAWVCTGRTLHGITSMNHFNADQATCGFGCSGNPYDAWWAFSVLGWGDSHEMGHNIQRLHINTRSGATATGEVSNNIYPSYVIYKWNKDHPSWYTMSKEYEQDIFYKGLVNAQKAAVPYDAMSKMIWDGDNPSASVITEVPNWGLYRLSFYLQLVHQSNKNARVKFGNGGWDLITMLYMADRLRGVAQNDATLWAAQKAGLGMDTYSNTEAQAINNNDKLLLQTSWVTKTDQRPFFDMYGIAYTAKASTQVAAYAFPAATKTFYYLPYDTNGKAFWVTDAVGTLPVDATTRTIPRIPLNFTVSPDDTKIAIQGSPLTLTAYTGAAGTVNFKVNGTTISGCGAVTTRARTAAEPIDASIADVIATCAWTPLRTGTYTITNDLDNAAVGGLDATSPPLVLTVTASGTPVTPAAPAAPSAIPNDTAATVSWTAPEFDGGSPITGYTVTSSPGRFTCTTASTSCQVTGLTNNTAYTFTVHATNTIGSSPESPASAAVSPRGLPSAPTSVTGTAGNTTVALTWSAPASNGGSSITDYVIEYSKNSGTSWTAFAHTASTATAITVTGLSNGSAHIFRVSAKTALGTGAASANSAAITPLAAVPGAPTGIFAVAGDTVATISWTAPANNGGATITGYTVTASPGGLSCTASVTTCQVTGLTNSTAYTFTVHATNAVGSGPESAASVAVTPISLPGAPTGVTGTAGNTTVALSWTAPASAGSSAITDYVIEYSKNSGTSWTAFAHTASTTPAITVTGLTNGSVYIFRVSATSAVGTGAASANSAAITPAIPVTLPGSIKSVSAAPGNASVSLSWTAPGNTGGAPITDYTIEYTSNGGTTWTTFAHAPSSATTATVTGLTNGTTYLFRVSAVNSAGKGASSPNSAPITPTPPLSAPTAPSILSAAVAKGIVTLTIKAPTSNGGSPITKYQYQVAPSPAWTDVLPNATGKLLIKGLAKTTVTLAIRAVNRIGTSPASATFKVVVK